jgi:transglutaminase-like putative cysteine protease
MRKVLAGILLLTASVRVVSAQENYDASLIPKSMLSYASTVVRDDQETVTVKGIDDIEIDCKKAVTVLNKNGDDDAHIVLFYDKGEEVIKGIKGVVYNALGKPVGKFSQSDFEDVSAADGFSLFLSERVKHYLPAYTEYPYTIAYEYVERTKQTLGIPTWRPASYMEQAVQKSTFTFAARPDFKIRYKELNITVQPVIATDKDGDKTYTWQTGDLKAFKHEPYSPWYNNFLPTVRIAPQDFSYYGIAGQFTDWNTLGKWVYDKLVVPRQNLSPETIAHIQELTKDISDPRLKAKKIYEYMQSKTHYVSVQVGAGAEEPFLADEVDKQNYGDCKALVNYTQALLKAVGIPSYYCMVEAGRDYAASYLNDFASIDQGNHIILCVPFKNDTTWADCTSESIPFGYLGSFTDDRLVLACTPEGGKLMHTPKYPADTNLRSTNAKLTVDIDGGLAGSMTTVFKGVEYEDRDELIGESRTGQNKILQRIYPVNNLVVGKYELKQVKNQYPSTTENIQISAKEYASISDGKYFFLLNPVHRLDEAPKQIINRHNDVYIPRGYTRDDEVSYTLPPGYHSDKEPLNVSITKPFGSFSATMELKDGQLIYKRKLRVVDGTYPKDTYQDLVDFFQSVVDADDYTVSLAKN